MLDVMNRFGLSVLLVKLEALEVMFEMVVLIAIDELVLDLIDLVGMYIFFI
jgi:hypothetical protein